MLITRRIKSKKMNNPLREYARQVFSGKLGAGPISRNAEISILNWAVQQTRKIGKEASWESNVFRSFYKMKLHWLIKEMERGEKVHVIITAQEGGVKTECVCAPQLMYRILRKELDVKHLAKYPADILWPDGPYATAIFKARELDLWREKARVDDEDYTGLFKCRKCKSTKTTYYQMQTRSADEPMVRSIMSCVLFKLRLTVSRLLSDYIRHVQELWTQVEVLIIF